MKGLTQIILLRHVHTPANGHGDHVPMSGGQTDTGPSAVGEAQAAQLAEQLGPELVGVPVYSSPLKRAIRTARAVACGQRIHVRPDLREIDCGELEGVVISEVKRRYRAEWDENLRHADPDFRWPGGESYREFRRGLSGSDDAAQIDPAGEGQTAETATPPLLGTGRAG